MRFAPKMGQGSGLTGFGVLGCNTKTIKSLTAELLYLVLPDATKTLRITKQFFAFTEVVNDEKIL